METAQTAMIDWTRPLKTKNGRRAFLQHNLRKEGGIVHKLVSVSYYGQWQIDYEYTEEGKHLGNPSLDLENT